MSKKIVYNTAHPTVAFCGQRPKNPYGLVESHETTQKMAMTKRFPYCVTVSWSAEDEMYIARIPKLEGILGLDEQDPARAIRQAIERGQEALAVLADHNHPLPEPEEGGKKFSGQLIAHLNLALCYVELGRLEEARTEAAEVLRLNPNWSLEFTRQAPFKDPAVVERRVVALRKAGLK
jgi:hypothetical protein